MIDCNFKNEIINKIRLGEVDYATISNLIAEGYIDKVNDMEYYKECMAKRIENIRKITRMLNDMSVITMAEVFEATLDDDVLQRMMQYLSKTYNVEV